jgi:glycosyltransferase involved in cell wall biosynthesis
MLVSVAVPTCDRPHALDRCLASLSVIESEDWELLVIDQSDDIQSRRVAEAWGTKIPRLVYLRLDQKNASAARNLAIQTARGEVVAFIDDDCTISPDPQWLNHVSEAFEQEPEASLIFGSVTAGPHDAATTFLGGYEVSRGRRLRGSLDALKVRAIGASMSLRLAPGKQPGFDLLLGPGARFRSTQDWDYTYRVLAAGGLVLETPGIHVTHHGARPYAGGAASVKWRDYLYGTGACHVKLLRCGHWIMLAIIADRLVRSIGMIRPHRVLLRRGTHFGRLLMYVRGLRDGLRTPVDRQAGVFVSRTEKATQT